MSKYKEININKIKTISINSRKSKIDINRLAKPVFAGSSFHQFWTNLPETLAGSDLKELVSHITRAHRNGKPVLLMMGAHIIKVGLSPIVIELINKKIIQGIALNGAGAIHDVELTYFGKTSEDVTSYLRDGRFGMAKETADILNKTVQKGNSQSLGFGECLGKRITEDNPTHKGLSILARAYESGIPVTIHIAVGTDIVHQHESADGAAIGEASLRDFRIFAHLISLIDRGGVVMLFGSSVILPEVFLKALTVARNISGDVNHFITASFDMIEHYRPKVNVVERPTEQGGKGYSFIGHHEIMMPLLSAAILDELV